MPLHDWGLKMYSRVSQLTTHFTVAILIAGAMTAPASAQTKNVKKKHIVQKTLVTNDGWPIKITYYKHDKKRDTPVVILLHSRQRDSHVWTKDAGVADTLWGEGFAVVAVDLRKHGESKMKTATGASTDIGDLKPDDYKRMIAFDLEAVKKFIFLEHENQNLNMRKTAIVAPEMSAPLALNFAAADWNKAPYDDAPVPAMRTPRGQDIRALVLISPESSVKGITSAAAIRSLRDPYKNIAFLFCVGTKDKQDKGNTKKLFSQLKGRTKDSSKRMYLQEYPYNLRGMNLIGKKQVPIEKHMIVFLKKFLLDLDDEWTERRSRLER